MIALLRKLFPKPAPEPGQESNDEDRRVGLVLMVVIEQQLNALGVSFQKTPATDSYVRPTARGALIGIAFGALQGEGVELTEDNIADAVIAAFVFVFGEPIGREIAVETFEAFQAKDAEILRASEWARLDMLAYYENAGISSPAGYLLAVQGMI